MNVILYCRVSTDDQTLNCSIEMQERFMTAYCNQHKYNIINVYHEDYSAKHFDLRRPEMKKIYNYCRKHKKEIDKILFLRWDRYSRNVEFAFAYKRKFYDELGIEINSVESPIDFKSTEWSMLLAMYCGTAHTEDEKISRRTKDGIHGTLLQGKCANRAPRGYKNVRTDLNHTHVEIDTPKADIIRTVFNEVAKGLESPSLIRRRLCPYIPESSFFEMLRNIFYIGKIRVPAYKDDPETVVDGKHEAIISVDIFNKVQEILDSKKKGTPKLRKKIHPDLFLRQFLICPKCGHALTGAVSRGNGGKYAYYNCCEDGKHIRARAEKVNEGFARYVGSLKPKSEVLNLYKKIINDVRKEQTVNFSQEIEQLEEKKRIQQKRIQSAKDKYLDGEMSKSEKDEAVIHYQNEINVLDEKIKELTNKKMNNIKTKLEYSVSLIENMEKFILDAPVEVKIKLISSMFPEKIEYDGEKYRTNSYNKVLDLIFQQTNELRGDKNEKGERFLSSSNSVPRPGIEPGWVSPLVFETSASTYSAIWASFRLRVQR